LPRQLSRKPRLALTPKEREKTDIAAKERIPRGDGFFDDPTNFHP
jgi:hypothetical protein